MSEHERRSQEGAGGSPPGDAPQGSGLKLDDWLAELRRQPGMAGLAVDRDLERALLDLTRIAAHRSERIAGPITAYLVGLACGSLPEGDRAAKIRALAAALDQAGESGAASER